MSGYGWTGSGACIDLLKEFKGFGVLKGEFRIVKDPYGIKDLEASLVHNWDFIRHDVAIRDFLNYCEVLSRETGLFKKSGKDLSNKLGVDFMLESRLYINALTDFRYFGDTFVHRYNIPAFQNFFLKLRSKMGKKNAISMYFSRPSKDVFLKETQKYINNLFCAFNNIDTIVYHNMFDIQQDHIHASTISYVAGRYCKHLLMYQSNRYILPIDFYPRYFVDITDTIEMKKNALSCYGDVHDRNGMLFLSTIEQNKVWGYQSNMQIKESYAEGFVLVKSCN